MKIIERGTLPAEREWKFQCSHCRTKFECLESEGTVVNDPRDHDSVLAVHCPVCQRQTYGSPK